MKTSDIFEGDNSSMKKTFEEAVRHDPENKACAQAGYGDNYHGLGKIDCTCPAQKEECPPKYTVREVLDSLYFEEVDHDGDFDGYIHLTSNIDGSGTDLNISDLKLSNALSEARGREEANKCDECGGTDVVCAKGVMDSIRLARKDTIAGFVKEISTRRIVAGMGDWNNNPVEVGRFEELTHLLSFASSLKSNAPKV